MNQSTIANEAADTFRQAAAYIRHYGWQIQGMSRHGMPRCSMGALESANAKPRWNKRVAVLMYQSLYKELGGISLTQFNHRTKDGEEVARLYERTASRLTASSI